MTISWDKIIFQTSQTKNLQLAVFIEYCMKVFGESNITANFIWHIFASKILHKVAPSRAFTDVNLSLSVYLTLVMAGRGKEGQPPYF